MNAELPSNSPPYLSDDELIFVPRERVTFNFNPLKDRPFVNLDYDESDRQSDPLTVGVDPPVDFPTNSTSIGTSRSCIIYNPFSETEDPNREVIVLSDDDVQPRVPVDLHNKSKKKKKAIKKPVNVGRSSRKLRSQSRVKSAVVQAEENRKKKNPLKTPNNQSTAQKSACFSDNSVTTTENNVATTESSVTSTENPVATTEESVTSTENSPDLLVRELTERMEERKRAINALKKTKEAETALAKKLVREIMKPGRPCRSTVDRNSCSELTPKQQRDAESALARKLVQEMSKGFSFEQTIQSMQSTLSSNQGASNETSTRTQGKSTCNPRTCNKVNQSSQSKPQSESGPRKHSNNQNECSCCRTAIPVPMWYSNASQSLNRGCNVVCRSTRLAEEACHTPEQICSVSNNALFCDAQPNSSQAISYSSHGNNENWSGSTMTNVGASERLVEVALQSPEQMFQMSSNDLFQAVHPNGQWSDRLLTDGGGDRIIEQATQIAERGSQVPDNSSVGVALPDSPRGIRASPGNTRCSGPLEIGDRQSIGALMHSTIHPSHLVAPSDRSNATGGGGFIVPEGSDCFARVNPAEGNDRFVRVNPVVQSEPSCHRLTESDRLTRPEDSSSLHWNSEHREFPQARVQPSGTPNQVLGYATRPNLDHSLKRLAIIFQRRLAAVQRLQRIRDRQRMIAHPNGNGDTNPVIRSLLHSPSVSDADENPLLGQNAPQ